MHKNGNNNSSQYRNELKFRIIRTAMPLFKQKGIKAVRMDDIANILSISKRTLYEIYNNKEDLLLEGVKNDYYEMTKRIQDYAMTAENEIDIVVTFFRMKFADLDSITPKFFTELDKYEKVKLFMQEYKTEQQTEATEFIRKCIENGFFVPSINYGIIQEVCDYVMSSVISNSLYKKYTLEDIFCNFLIVLLRRFCTEKGLVLLDLYLKKTYV